jgi:hypothetical protein
VCLRLNSCYEEKFSVVVTQYRRFFPLDGVNPSWQQWPWLPEIIRGPRFLPCVAFLSHLPCHCHHAWWKMVPIISRTQPAVRGNSMVEPYPHLQPRSRGGSSHSPFQGWGTSHVAIPHCKRGWEVEPILSAMCSATMLPLMVVTDSLHHSTSRVGQHRVTQIGEMP